MAENENTPDAPPDPYAGKSPSEANPEAAKGPWGLAQPAAMPKDPAVRMQAPPDPFPKWGPALPGQIAGGGGANELMLAGIGQILERLTRIERLLEGGSRF